MPRKKRPFTKSADSSVSVQKSIEDIKALVRRYGASGFGVQEDYRSGRVVVSFVLPSGDGHIPVQIPCEVEKVHARMFDGGAHDAYANKAGVANARREQAERTAWRQLYVIIDALLTAVALGMVSITDAFLAHTMVVSEDGRAERMGDYLARTQGVLAPGARALLGSGGGG